MGNSRFSVLGCCSLLILWTHSWSCTILLLLFDFQVYKAVGRRSWNGGTRSISNQFFVFSSAIETNYNQQIEKGLGEKNKQTKASETHQDWKFGKVHRQPDLPNKPVPLMMTTSVLKLLQAVPLPWHILIMFHRSKPREWYTRDSQLCKKFSKHPKLPSPFRVI